MGSHEGASAHGVVSLLVAFAIRVGNYVTVSVRILVFWVNSFPPRCLPG